MSQVKAIRMLDDQDDYAPEIIRVTGNGLKDDDYDDLTPYETEQVAKAQKKAIEQFDDSIQKLMTPKDVNEHKRAAILAAFITLPIILVALMFLHSMSPKTAVDDLRLDAAHGVYVADKAGVLDDKVKQQAYDLNKKLEKSDYHAQIMVVVVDRVPHKYGSINDYSMAIAEKYKPGARGQNTGLLYTVAIKDHKARLEVGYGLEGKLPDAYTVRLQQPANAHYKNGEYSAGVSALLDGVQQTLLDGKPIDDLAVSSRNVQEKTDGFWADCVRFLLFMIVLINLIVLIILVLSFVGSVYHERERLDRIKNPEKYEKVDAITRKMMLEGATYNVLHPHTDSSSSNGLHDSGWSSGSSSSSSGGGDFGGGGATTDW